MCSVCVWVLVQPTKARRRRAPGRTTAARTTAGARWTRGRRPRTRRASTQELGTPTPLRGRSGCPVRDEVGVPCQPPPVPPNATTSPRDGLRAPVQAAHRPPSRGRRRRDNDRPAPPGTGVQRGGFAVGTCADLHKSPPGETRNGDCSPLHSPKRCVRHCPRPLTVVKWYRIYADWYKTDTSRPGAVVNKTQPKAPLPREGFGMRLRLRPNFCQIRTASDPTLLPQIY